MISPGKTPIGDICMLSTHGFFDPVPQLGRTDTGGQVVYVLELAKALAQDGRKVDIFTRWFDRSQAQVDPVPGHPGVRVVRIPAGPWEFLPKEEIYDVLPELARNMVDFLREKGWEYDLFHGHYVDAGIATLEVAEAFGRPAFFTAHSIGAWKREQMKGDPGEMEKKYKFKHRIAEELRIFRTVAAQSVTTQVQKEKLDELYGFRADNVAVISPGVDVHTFCPPAPGEAKTEAGLPGRYVLCLSRIDANKGHDLLLNAFDLVLREVPNIELVIGGGSPRPQERERQIVASIKTIIEEKQMQQKVHVVGYVPDEMMVPFYQQAEVFVLPSIFEPFGMTSLEAMACETPVVASKFGGIRTVIDSGKNGLLVDSANAREFADAIISLLNDVPTTKRLGRAAYDTVQKHYSWEAIAEKHIAFYQKYINS